MLYKNKLSPHESAGFQIFKILKNTIAEDRFQIPLFPINPKYNFLFQFKHFSTNKKKTVL